MKYFNAACRQVKASDPKSSQSPTRKCVNGFSVFSRSLEYIEGDAEIIGLAENKQSGAEHAASLGNLI